MAKKKKKKMYLMFFFLGQTEQRRLTSKRSAGTPSSYMTPVFFLDEHHQYRRTRHSYVKHAHNAGVNVISRRRVGACVGNERLEPGTDVAKANLDTCEKD